MSDLGNLQVAISPVIKVILNTKSLTIFFKGLPIIKNIPEDLEPVVSIDVALNSGILISSLASFISPKFINLSVFFGLHNFGSFGTFIKFSDSLISRPIHSISFSNSKLFISQFKITGIFYLLALF